MSEEEWGVTVFPKLHHGGVGSQAGSSEPLTIAQPGQSGRVDLEGHHKLCLMKQKAARYRGKGSSSAGCWGVGE